MSRNCISSQCGKPITRNLKVGTVCTIYFWQTCGRFVTVISWGHSHPFIPRYPHWNQRAMLQQLICCSSLPRNSSEDLWVETTSLVGYKTTVGQIRTYFCMRRSQTSKRSWLTVGHGGVAAPLAGGFPKGHQSLIASSGNTGREVGSSMRCNQLIGGHIPGTFFGQNLPRH